MIKNLWKLACFVLAMTFMHTAPAMAGVIGDTARCTVWVREHAVLNGRVGITEAEAMRLRPGFRYQRPDGNWRELGPGGHFWGDCRSFVSAGGRVSAAATATTPPAATDATAEGAAELTEAVAARVAAEAEAILRTAEAARIAKEAEAAAKAAEAARAAAEAEANAQTAKRLAAWFAEQGDAAATWVRNAIPTGDWLSAIPAVAKTIFAGVVTLVVALLAYLAFAVNRARTENPEPIDRPELPLVHPMPFQSQPPVEYVDEEPDSLMDAFEHPQQPPEPEPTLAAEADNDLLPDAANQDAPADLPHAEVDAAPSAVSSQDISGLLELLHGPEHVEPEPTAPAERTVDIMGAIAALHGPDRPTPEPEPIPVGDVVPSPEFQRMLDETQKRIAGGDL